MTEIARQLRRELTFPERLIWSRLRRARSRGRTFRRQQVVGQYIVDFYCPGARLVVELDGRSHQERGADDARRQEYLESVGLRVIRFRNDDVVRDTDSVVEAIVQAAGPNA